MMTPEYICFKNETVATIRVRRDNALLWVDCAITVSGRLTTKTRAIARSDQARTIRAAGLPLRTIAGSLPQNANSRGDHWSLPLLERGNGECRATRPQVSGPTASIWSLRLFEIVAMRSQPSGEDWLASSSMPDRLASRYRALRGKRFDTEHNVRSTKLFRLLFLPCSYQQVQLDRRWAGRLRWPSA
jgi:hypothetical protein